MSRLGIFIERLTAGAAGNGIEHLHAARFCVQASEQIRDFDGQAVKYIDVYLVIKEMYI